MTYIPFINNDAERLNAAKANIGYGEFIVSFAQRLRTEPGDISSTVEIMKKAMMSDRVSKWAERTNYLNEHGNVKTSLTPDQLAAAHQSEVTVSGMASKLPDELGGLRTFSPVKNTEYLDAMTAEASSNTDANPKHFDSTDPNLELTLDPIAAAREAVDKQFALAS